VAQLTAVLGVVTVIAGEEVECRKTASDLSTAVAAPARAVIRMLAEFDPDPLGVHGQLVAEPASPVHPGMGK